MYGSEFRLEDTILGESRILHHLAATADIGVMAIRLAEQSRRRIRLYSYDLDPRVYDQPEFVESVKQLVLGSQMAQVRILLQDNTLIRQRPHALVDLAQRLTSSIEIRRPSEIHLQQPQNFILADESGYLQRNLTDPRQATGCFNDPLKVSHLAGLFNEVWEQATPDIEALRLHL